MVSLIRGRDQGLGRRSEQLRLVTPMRVASFRGISRLQQKSGFSDQSGAGTDALPLARVGRLASEVGEQSRPNSLRPVDRAHDVGDRRDWFRRSGERYSAILEVLAQELVDLDPGLFRLKMSISRPIRRADEPVCNVRKMP